MLSGCGRFAARKSTTNAAAVTTASVRRLSSTSVIARTTRSPQGRTRDDKLRWNYNPNPFDPAPIDEAASRSFPLLTAQDLSKHTVPPRKIKLLARDFIDDSLYNPYYGYFPTQAVIFDPDGGSQFENATPAAFDRREGLDFANFRDIDAWNAAVAERYGAIEGTVDTTGAGRQVWHTPTELFKPYYAQAIARHLAAEYRLALFPHHNLLIYEIGAGNGSLMTGVLDYLRDEQPEIYERTQYHTIEISSRLAGVQRARAARRGHADHVRVEERSIFDWSEKVNKPCSVLAFEVLDNLAHDVVRYTVEDHEPLQCVVEIDERGEFAETYVPVTDGLISKFLKLQHRIYAQNPAAASSFPRVLARSSWLRRLYGNLPFAPNLSPPHFLPTKSLALLRVLRKYFPQHRILLSDFDSLPDTVPGKTAPVVQTRYKGGMVTCSTYLVSQGWFDIFFPTDFRFLRSMYEHVLTNSSGDVGKEEDASEEDRNARRSLRILSHREFLARYGEPERTTLRDGSNPMLDLYENAAFMY